MRGRPTNEQFRQQLDHLIQTLKSEITEGRYEPGTELPSEKALAARFGLSNISVRKGLGTLAEEGWIEKIPNVGNRVMRRRPSVVLTLGLNETTVRNMALTELLEDFGRLHSWINVKLKMYSTSPEYERANADTIDVFTLSTMQFQQLCDQGGTGILEPREADPELYPFLNELFSHEGVSYLQPVIFGPVVLCYNKRHFRDRGLAEPTGGWTWHDLVHCAEKLTEGERYGFCFHLPDINRWPIFLLQSGERLAAKWKPHGADDASRLVEGARLCKEIVYNRNAFPMYMSEDNEDIGRMFLEGKLSMALVSYMALNDWKQADVEYDIAPVPFMHEPRTIVIATGAAVASASKHKEEARLLVDYLISDRAQSLIRKHTLSVPARQRTEPSGWGEQIVNIPSRYMLYRDMLFSYRTHRDLPVAVSSLAMLSRLLKAYWANMATEEQLYRDIGELIDHRGGRTDS
ncbi:MAG: GntR family transcriptional regulator [Paenibacillus sp.]|nr:GntR family transcriptional regulator [Paenibacillus sp.]